MAIFRLPSVDSTNRYCEALDLAQVEDFTCYWALEQIAGIGQRGNTWVSNAGENLTFSLVLKPTWLAAVDQFKLTQMLSLAMVDFHYSLLTTHYSLKIKWPNDIYVDGHKICGMLVSNRVVGDNLASATCGIGLNVNQRVFPSWVPHPTSLSLLTGETYDLEPLLKNLLECIWRRYEALRQGEELEAEYLIHLMNRGVAARYRHKGQEITATINGVDRHGRLMLTADSGEKLVCAMKEIELI